MDFAENGFDDSDRSLRLRPRARGRPFGRGAFIPRRGVRRIVLAVATLVLTLCLFAAVAAGLFFVRLAHGPITVSLENQVSTALAARVKHGFKFEVGSTAVQSDAGRPALVVKRLLVADEAGRAVIRAPEATLTLDPLQMLSGNIVPTRLDVHDLTLKLVILPDGDVALSAGTDETLPFRLSEAFESAAPSPAQARKAAADATASGAKALPTSEPGQDAFDRLARMLLPLLDQFTGSKETLAGFDRLGIARGMLVLDDRPHNSVKTFRNLDFEFERKGTGSAQLSVSADGTSGRWSSTLSGTHQADGRRTLALAVDNVVLEDLNTVPALRDPGFDSDMPVAATLDAVLGPKGELAGLDGQVKLGPGYFRLNDPDHEPLLVDAVTVPVRFDADKRALVVAAAAIRTDTSDYTFSGQLLPPSETSTWAFNARGSGTVGPERPNETPIAIENVTAAIRLDPVAGRLTIDRLDIAGPQVDMGLTATVEHGPDGIKIATKATAGRMPAPVVLRLWPTTLSAGVRSWLLANLQGGMVERGTATAQLDDADLDKMKHGRSVADGHLRVDYAVSGLTLNFMNGVPPLRGLVGTGAVTGDTSRLTLSRGSMEVAPGRQLSLSDGSLWVPSTDPKPAPAVISAHVNGPVDVLADLLARDALKGYATVPTDAASAKGQIDGTLSVSLELGPHARSDAVKIGANAKITGLAIDKLVGKQDLTNGTISLVLDKSGLHAKGDAALAGAPTTIDVKKPAGTGLGEANIQMVLDEAARLKAGLSFGRALTGPVTAKITTALGAPDTKANVELDLSRATLTNVVPGLSKAAGKPGRVTLVATQRDNGVALDNVICDIGAFSARGSANLDANGSLHSAKMTQLRISPGDDLKADAVQDGGALKLTVRGANLDARPFLKALSDPDTGDNKDLDLDLHANVLTGQNDQAMTGVDLKLVRRNGQLRKVQMTGKFGRSPVSIASVPQGAVLTVTATSDDAGAGLEFLDLYKRVDGGRLETTIRMMNGRWDGSAVVHEFGLREDPAMKRLTEESLTQRKAADAHIDAGNLRFTKLFVDFSKFGSRVEVKEGAMFGPQMGATVKGSVDFGRDRLALAGTFVPIYGVNNLFSQVPLVGPILGGGANEGLFGINYKITGPVGTPNLSVDPLSALAPGFLRQIFGAISDAANPDLPPQPSTAPPVEPQAR